MTNMFKPSKANNIEEYLDMVPEDRKESIMFLHKFIQGISPALTSHFAYNMLGYGSFLYQNYKKEMIEWPVVSLASHKNYMTLYICALDNGQYLAEKYKDSLGKVRVGKSCIRFKKLADLDLTVLKEVLFKAANTPGLL